MQANIVDRLEKEIIKLSPEEQLSLIKKLAIHLKLKKGHETGISWKDVKGSAKGLWDIDAQEFINVLREDRL